jgi:N-acetylmuramoyl-L-alanine amidase
MRRLTRAAALSAAALLFCATGSPSIAQQSIPAIVNGDSATGPLSAGSVGLAADPAPPADAFVSPSPLVSHAIAPLPPQSALGAAQGEDEASTRPSRSLADLVYENQAAATPDEETDCLARAVYWESKGEPLAGQLAVADVIINRAESGRFASTLCGVVRQRSQFSFVHGGYIPPAPQGSAQWRTAVAIARIARGNLAGADAPQALFFHARYVHPGWHLTRVAALGNHVFYR